MPWDFQRQGRWLVLLGSLVLIPGCLTYHTGKWLRHLPTPISGPPDVQAATHLGPPLGPPPDAADEKENDKEKPTKSLQKIKGVLELPKELPGAEAPPIQMPVPLPKDEKERAAVVRKLYPDLSALAPELAPLYPADATVLTLADLQKIAREHSPALRKASAEVTAAKGAAIQAGLPPNPTIGFEGDQIEPRTPVVNVPQYGAFFTQLIKTPGKLKLAQAAAIMDYFNAQVRLRQTEVEVMNQVRGHYFEVLVAEQVIRVAGALTKLIDATLSVQISRVREGEAAVYEPLQLRVFAAQARNTVIQGRNHYMGAWKQLAASMGVPEMPPAPLAGRVDAVPPLFAYPKSLERMLTVHTELAMAQNDIYRAEYNLQLSKLMRLPDLAWYNSVQHDNGTGNNQANIQVGFQDLPIFNQNQGAILQAKGDLASANAHLLLTRNDLTRRLAQAFAEYNSSRLQVDNYRQTILADQVRVYRATVLRYQQEPDKITYSDLVNLQQNMITVLTTYLQLLGTQWQGVVDVALLMQIDELYPPGTEECPAGPTLVDQLLQPQTSPAQPAPAGQPHAPAAQAFPRQAAAAAVAGQPALAVVPQRQPPVATVSLQIPYGR